MAATGAGLDTALRRVVLRYRVVGAVWLWLLVLVTVVTEQPELWAVLATGALATVWTVVTLRAGWRRPDLLRAPAWLVADTAVSVAVVVLSTAADAKRGFTGGYPFSTVLLVAWAAGRRGALAAAVALSAVSLLLLGAGEAIGSALIYFAGAGITAWGMQVLLRNEEQRRALEQRLAEEQAERMRSQERAETAAALHDGVLQTLALIQRRPDDPAAVAALARRQERDLREWLGGSRSRLGGAPRSGTFAAAVKDMVADVEADHGLTVEVVTVGDTPCTPDVEALVTAAGEALRNVGKHAGVTAASVYAEARPETATIFVRDRGAGFDLASVPADRRGIAESIVGRLQRHGGSAQIRTAGGRGTEVELTLPLTPSG